MALDQRPLPTLNEEQVDAILIEALQRGLYEADVNGDLPEDRGERLTVAQTLVVMARQAADGGSKDEDVTAVLFIAEVDMQPQAALTQGEDVASDMTMIGNAAIVKMEAALAADESTPTELALVHAEMERRGLREPAETNGNGVPAEEAPAAAQDDPEAAERRELESQLTLAVLRNHKIGPEDVESMSLESLRWIVAHPGGAGESAAEEPVAQDPPEVPEPQGETVETVRIMTTPPEATEPVSATPALSSEREALEEQVTGPMLKAYGRGRDDVPGIGDNELRFMIEHPEGRHVTLEDLEAAKALDAGGEAPAPVAEEPEPEAPAPAESDAAFAPPEPVEGVVSTEGQPATTLRDGTPIADAEQSVPDTEAPDPEPAQQEAASVAPKPPAEIHVPEEAQRDPVAHFNEVVAHERLPIPIEVPDGEMPIMPFDMSKESREAIYSLHARFHACEARIAFLIMDIEDRVGDYEKLRKGRELEVAEELPMTIDRKKVTESQRAAMIASDEQVKVYVAAEHNAKKELRRMHVLRDNYHRDVERCSRQMNKWEKEARGL